MHMLYKTVLLVCFTWIWLTTAGCDKQSDNSATQAGSFMNKGMSYYHEGRFDKALKYFEKALAIEPDNPQAVLYTALMYDELETDLTRAVKLYEEFIKTSTDVEKVKLAKNWLGALENKISGIKITEGPAAVTARTVTDPDNEQSVLKRLEDQVAQQEKTIGDLRKELMLSRQMLENVLQKEKEYTNLIEKLQSDLQAQATKLAAYQSIPSYDNDKADFRSSMVNDLVFKELNGHPVALTMTYTVEDGDTLQSVSKKCYGDTQLWTVIWETNKFQLGDSKTLSAGQTLIVPKILRSKE